MPSNTGSPSAGSLPLTRLQKLEWDQLYRDPGLRWEAILSRLGPGGRRIYSLRLTQRLRADQFWHATAGAC